MDHKKYIDIPAFQTKYANAFTPNDLIQITEKIDGSNAHLTYDEATDSVQAGSRKNIVTKDLSLNGLYEFAQHLDKEAFKAYKGYYIFGEWHLHHLIKYPADKDNRFWSFDVWDSVNQCWMPQTFVKKMAEDCGLDYVPVFYEGYFISWEHVAQFIGQSLMGAELGEGVVCKNQSRPNTIHSSCPSVVKLVHEKYKERMDKPATRPIDPDALAKIEYETNLVKTVVTKNRVDKLLYKMVNEDGILHSDWGPEEMPIIAKNLPRLVYTDCVKEAKDVVDQVENFGRYCNKITMELVKEILKER